MRVALIILLGLVFWLWLLERTEARPLSYNRYDPIIQESVNTWWSDFRDWKYWKAQLYQESLLEDDPVSWAGAQGIAQFMPATWAEVSRELALHGATPNQVRPAILAGAYYMRKQRNGWRQRIRGPLNRHFHAAASYNAGFGNVSRAWQRCGQPQWWDTTVTCLPSVTGRHAKETKTYIERIRRWRQQLEVM